MPIARNAGQPQTVLHNETIPVIHNASPDAGASGNEADWNQADWQTDFYGDKTNTVKEIKKLVIQTTGFSL